jgi:CheY-like chemotaxis protein
MTNNTRLMIVDDSPEDIHMLLAEFKDQYQLHAATSADDALQMLGDIEKPKLILLDVNMPGTDGYEACKLLKQDSNFADIPVIFLSANDSTEEIIQGLEAGAIDYVIKPYDPSILQTKVKSALALSDKKMQLRQQAEMANQMVHTVMAESGNLGTIINFYRSSFNVQSAKLLAELIVEALESQGLDSVAFLSKQHILEMHSSSGMPTMLEIELMERLVDGSDPFVERGNSCFVVHQNVVALVKNMPEDEVKRGALKDQLKIMLEAAQAKLEYFLEMESAASEKTKKIGGVIIETKSSLDELRNNQEAHKKRSMEILDEMVEKVEGSFFSLGLTDAQEEQLLNLLSESVHESLEHLETGLKMDENIKHLVIKLSEAAQDAAR